MYYKYMPFEAVLGCQNQISGSKLHKNGSPNSDIDTLGGIPSPWGRPTAEFGSHALQSLTDSQAKKPRTSKY